LTRGPAAPARAARDRAASAAAAEGKRLADAITAAGLRGFDPACPHCRERGEACAEHRPR
jgi:hypothetical protein